MAEYRLLNKNGFYTSEIKGQFGGNKALKIYGRLDCKSALRWIKKKHYVKHRVFFANETDAIEAGYRPCGVCMKESFKKWKGNPKSYGAKILKDFIQELDGMSPKKFKKVVKEMRQIEKEINGSKTNN